MTMNDAQANPGLLSPREAASYLRISTKTLIALVNDGAIRVIDVGRGLVSG
jgi:excisionase family DNA binding protein